MILKKILELTNIEEFIIPPRKSYFFLKFATQHDAQIIYKNFMGQVMFDASPPLLISYCTKINQLEQGSNEGEPTGLYLFEDFITPELENTLISLLECDSDQHKIKNREVLHFGYEFIYGTNNVDYDCPLEKKIPDECNELWKLLAEKCPIFSSFRPNQLTVNRYDPGNGIASHCDTHSAFEDPIVSLSLGSSINMDFKSIDGKHCSKLLPARSLLIMSGESRYGWSHGISQKKSDIVKTEHNFLTVQPRKLRYSYTFRKLLVPPSCQNCKYSALCDVQQPAKEIQSKIDGSIAAKLEMENVHNVYNEIGNHFSQTRHSPWPKIENFINNLPENSILLDVGCGNGKYLRINDKIAKFGCDRSEKLIQICHQRNFQVFQCDCLQIPIKDGSIDACISIAVIHHLATPERRLQAIKEMLRILNVNGLALVYVWAKDQIKDNLKTCYLLQHPKKSNKTTDKTPEIATLNIDENRINLPIHQNRTQFSHSNVLVPWHLKEGKNVNNVEDQHKVFLRYYHVFESGELEAMCRLCENAEIINSYYDQGNHCVILRKVR